MMKTRKVQRANGDTLRITIPNWIVDRFNIVAGDRLEFIEDGDKIVVKKIEPMEDIFE